jgi:hypothetical protein
VRIPLGRLVIQSTVLLMVVIGALILLLALLILFHQNTNATKGYELRTLERERSRLLLDQETLNMKIARAQSLEELEGDPRVQAMVSVRSPTYVAEDSTVARYDDDVQ